MQSQQQVLEAQRHTSPLLLLVPLSLPLLLLLLVSPFSSKLNP